MKIFFKKPVRIILFIFWLPVGVFLTLYKVGKDFINYDGNKIDQNIKKYKKHNEN
tara:strand:- start:1062 stop:1226 length:165 start_codon:yes stop_codon:yes gene_type:complete